MSVSAARSIARILTRTCEVRGVLSQDGGQGLFDGRAEVRKDGTLAGIERTAFGELPRSLDQVQIGCE